MYHKYIKRFFDIILSLCCIIISSPILLVTALLVRIKLGSPVIFKQERPGYHNEIFTLYKFRSMTDAVDENGDLLPDKERLPRFGQMLRSTSLDELPEFFNILFGHMSFVGPRPLLKQYIDFFPADGISSIHLCKSCQSWSYICTSFLSCTVEIYVLFQ